MTLSERYAVQIIRLWVVRRDVYVIQRPGTSSDGEGKPLTNTVIAQASRGEIPLVVFPCGKDGCGFSALDIDVKKPGQEAQNEQIARQLWAASGPGTILEQSGPGSYHVTKFYAQPQRPEQLVAFQQKLLEGCPRFIEICPRAPKDKFPKSFSAIRVPGINPKKGFVSKIWDGTQWLEFNTEWFVTFLENFKPDAEPILPAAERWPSALKAVGQSLQNVPAPVAPKKGPGTELHKLLKKFGWHENVGCHCASRIASMNVWGPHKCAENLEVIVGWLKEEYERRQGICGKGKFTGWNKAIEFGARLLVKKAIRAAKRAEANSIA